MLHNAKILARLQDDGVTIGDVGDIIGKVGDRMEIVGYGLIATGFGAELGVVLVLTGEGLSIVGTGLETVGDVSDGKYKTALAKGALTLVTNQAGSSLIKQLAKTGKVSEAARELIRSSSTYVVGETAEDIIDKQNLDKK